MDMALIWPDTHVPYQDIRAVDLVREVGTYFLGDLKQIVLLGDFGDFLPISSHPRHPLSPKTLIEEVEGINRELDMIDMLFPSVRKSYVMGNHEHRFERYLTNKAPELFGLTSVDNLLGLDRRPMWASHEYRPDQAVRVLNTDLIARHEPLGSSARASVTRSVSSVVYGHIHRIEESSIVGMDGRVHTNFSVGWLGDKTKNDVFGFVKGHHQWQLGFGLVWSMGGGKFQHHKVHIVVDGRKRRCVVGGKMFSIGS